MAVTMTSWMTADQTTLVENFLTDAISAIVSLFYTIITTITNFLLKPEILGIVATMIILGIVYGALRRKMGKRVGL